MKKNVLKTITGSAVAGCLLLSLSMTAFATSGSGYDKYKEAVKSTALTQNATISTQFQLKDNGAVILKGNSTQQLNKDSMLSKTSFTMDGVSKTYESSTDNGKSITAVDGKYYSMNIGDGKAGKDERAKLSESSSTVKLAEMAVDTLVGDVKNQFVNDGETISVKLEGAQIPELAKLALSTVAENSSRMNDYKNYNSQGQDYDKNMEAVFKKMPKLNNLNIESIELTATIDGKILKNNSLTVVISGQDEKGAYHELTVNFEAEISEVGNTKVNAIDTTGKEVNTSDFSNNYHNR